MSEPIKSVVIFDLDGCVSDDTWRKHLLPAEGSIGDEAYAAYHAECFKDPLLFNGANILRDHIKQGHIILFCTARPISVGEKTAEWISANFNLTNKEFSILMRQAGDTRHSVELKAEFADFIIKNSQQNGSPIVAAYDDRPEVVEMYRSKGLNAAVLDRNGITAPPPQKVTDQPFTDSPNANAGDRLRQAAELFATKNAEYKDDYKRVGRLYVELFPEGVTLKTVGDFNRFTMFMMMLHKLGRYARNFDERHGDSLKDLAIYAMMLSEVDGE